MSCASTAFHRDRNKKDFLAQIMASCVRLILKFASINLPALEVKGPIFLCVYVLRGTGRGLCFSVCGKWKGRRVFVDMYLCVFLTSF